MATPSPDTIKDTTEKLASFTQWLVELIQRRKWFTLLLLVDVAWFFFGNPGVFGAIYKLITAQELPPGYWIIWLLILGLIFIAALVLATITMPLPVKLDVSDAGARTAIKGLRAFGSEDAEIFAKLQRNQSLQNCLESITRREFRFGILVAESGCGKTSFLQAGMMPRLNRPESKVKGVYVKFSDRPPLPTIYAELVDQLQIPKELVDQADFLTVLAVAVDAAQKPIVLMLDQFEQFFVHQPRKPDREPFIHALTAWYHDPNPPAVKILVSIRADLQYELNQLQQALEYTLSRYEIFQLERFDPQEATEILRVLAETEQLEFDRHFVEDLTQKELTTLEGKVSPVDLQILAEVVRKQKTKEERAFSREAFQKLGGIDGLLNRYLEETLQTLRFQGYQTLYQTTIQVLLMLTDRERNVRAGVLTVPTLQELLLGIATGKEVLTAVEWLTSSEVRLITPVEQNNTSGYELAHERIIPALLRLAGKELKDADRANQMLERRVNEWIGNQYRPRYLLTWKELWLIQRQNNQLTWGKNRRQKEKLLKQSWRRWQARCWAGIGILILMLSAWLGSLTPSAQRWHMQQQLVHTSPRASRPSQQAAARAFATNQDWKRSRTIIGLMVNTPGDAAASWINVAEVAMTLKELDQAKELLGQARTSADKVTNDYFKAGALIDIVTAYGKLNDPVMAKTGLEQAQITADKLTDDDSKAEALIDIATAYGKLNDPVMAKAGLKQAQITADKITNDDSKARALIDIVTAYGELNDPVLAKAGLEQAQITADKLTDDDSKARALSAIATAYGKLNDPVIAKAGLEQAQITADKITDDYSKASALSAIATAYGKLNDSVLAKAGLEQAQITADKITDDYSKASALSDIATAYGKLNDPVLAETGLEQAQITADKITNDSSKAWALSAIATAYGKLNDPVIAKAGLEQAQIAADKIQEAEAKSQILKAIAQSQCEIGELLWKQNQIKPAQTIIDQAEHTIESVQEVPDRNGFNNSNLKVQALQTLVQMRIKLEEWRQANHAVGMCASDECRVAVLAQALETWAEVKHPELAEFKKQKMKEEKEAQGLDSDE